ncbi:Eukaryotic translation initiation factor 4H [Sparganum proliferum]
MAARNFVQPDAPRYRVYIGNLPKNCLASNIEHIFEGCKIAEVHMVRNPETDEFRGFAYVELKDQDSYNTALSCDGMFVDGVPIRVNDAERRGGRGGPGGRGGRAGNFPRGEGGNRDFGGPGRDFDNQGFRSGRQSNFRSGPGGRNGGGGAGGYGFDKPRAGGYRPKVQQPFQAPEPAPIVDYEDRPRLSLQPRRKPLHAPAEERELSERAKAIFGVGKPRSPSPPGGSDVNVPSEGTQSTTPTPHECIFASGMSASSKSSETTSKTPIPPLPLILIAVKLTLPSSALPPPIP